jgi:hypothetical protein
MQEGLLGASSLVRSRIEQRGEQVGGGDDALLIVFGELDGGLKGPGSCLGQLGRIHRGSKFGCGCRCWESVGRKVEREERAKREARDLVVSAMTAPRTGSRTRVATFT